MQLFVIEFRPYVTLYSWYIIFITSLCVGILYFVSLQRGLKYFIFRIALRDPSDFAIVNIVEKYIRYYLDTEIWLLFPTFVDFHPIVFVAVFLDMVYSKGWILYLILKFDLHSIFHYSNNFLVRCNFFSKLILFM